MNLGIFARGIGAARDTDDRPAPGEMVKCGEIAGWHGPAGIGHHMQLSTIQG